MFLLRSINYDEKDPFLCNACGFCKYARFDFMLHAKPCCAVDPIENEEDRKKVSRIELSICLKIAWAWQNISSQYDQSLKPIWLRPSCLPTVWPAAFW